MSDVHELTETFLAEWRVFTGLYGSSYPEQIAWARGALPPEAVDHYMDSWTQGRECCARYLRWMASRLRQRAGTEIDFWLELCALPHEQVPARWALESRALSD